MTDTEQYKQAVEAHRKEQVAAMIAGGLSYTDAMLVFDLAHHAMNEAHRAVMETINRLPDNNTKYVGAALACMLCARSFEAGVDLLKEGS